jgi:hypothetical protein
VWQELERWGAAVALVRFSGGGGRTGTVGAVTLESDEGRELARWGEGEGELPEALAAPLWGRYALFAGHPRISGLLMWDARSREIAVAGKRGGKDYGEVLIPRPLSRVTLTPPGDVSRDVSPPALAVGPGPSGGQDHGWRSATSRRRIASRRTARSGLVHRLMSGRGSSNGSIHSSSGGQSPGPGPTLQRSYSFR